MGDLCKSIFKYCTLKNDNLRYTSVWHPHQMMKCLSLDETYRVSIIVNLMEVNILIFRKIAKIQEMLHVSCLHQKILQSKT